MKMFERCLQLQEHLLTQVDENNMFEGSMVAILRDLGYDNGSSWHNAVVTPLKDMGVIELLRRGGGKASSQYSVRAELITEEEFDQRPNADVDKRSNKGKAAIRQIASDLGSRMDLTEQRLDQIVDRLEDLEKAVN